MEIIQSVPYYQAQLVLLHCVADRAQIYGSGQVRVGGGGEQLLAGGSGAARASLAPPGSAA